MAKRILKPRRRISVPKACYFCTQNLEPTFKEVGVLQRFLTERGKITPSSRNGICSKHQKELGRSIKYARHLSLLPFVARE